MYTLLKDFERETVSCMYPLLKDFERETVIHTLFFPESFTHTHTHNTPRIKGTIPRHGVYIPSIKGAIPRVVQHVTYPLGVSSGAQDPVVTCIGQCKIPNLDGFLCGDSGRYVLRCFRAVLATPV